MEAVKSLLAELKHEWISNRDRVAPLLAANPATTILVFVSLLSIVTVLANSVIQVLSWIMYSLNFIASRAFIMVYPAMLVAIIAAWIISAFRINRLHNFIIPREYPSVALVLRLIVCVIAGQLTLFCLPPVVRFFAMPFSSAPTLLFTIIFSVFVVFYGVYLILSKTILPTLDRQPRFVVGDFAQNRHGLDVGDDVCIVCLANPKTHLIKPCNHFCVCLDCIRQLNECPVCKRPINMYERIYST